MAHREVAHQNDRASLHELLECRDDDRGSLIAPAPEGIANRLLLRGGILHVVAGSPTLGQSNTARSVAVPILSTHDRSHCPDGF